MIAHATVQIRRDDSPALRRGVEGLLTTPPALESEQQDRPKKATKKR
jgi:hypothetical protein